jgi:hypothetical protein
MGGHPAADPGLFRRGRPGHLRHDSQKLQRFVGEVLAGVSLDGPVEFARVSAGIARGSIGLCATQFGIGQPHHQSRAGDVVHRRSLMRSHANANNHDRVVLEFDLGTAGTGR